MDAQPPTAAAHLRALRALPFATVCTVVSAAGHELVSGAAVAPRLLLGGWLAVWALATALAGRERSLGAITGGLAIGQLGLHLLFHLGAGPMTATPGGPGAVARQLLCGPLPPGTSAAQVLAGAGLDPHAYAAPAPMGLGPTMLAGHALAALACGWWLRRGEAALWRLLRTRVLAPLRLLLAALTGLPPARPAPRPARRPADRPVPGSAPLRHAVVRRGPPARCRAA